MIIEGRGSQYVLNDSFGNFPSKVIINGKVYNTSSALYELGNNINNITLIFTEEIDSCENMFYS